MGPYTYFFFYASRKKTRMYFEIQYTLYQINSAEECGSNQGLGRSFHLKPCEN